jgi:hypothetical protein
VGRRLEGIALAALAAVWTTSLIADGVALEDPPLAARFPSNPPPL